MGFAFYEKRIVVSACKFDTDVNYRTADGCTTIGVNAGDYLAFENCGGGDGTPFTLPADEFERQFTPVPGTAVEPNVRDTGKGLRDCEVDILGKQWTVRLRRKREDSELATCDGYCDYTIHQIVIRKYKEKPKPNQYEDAVYHMRRTLRHEIVHAFLFESGLAGDSGNVRTWAMNEEMIDWIAFQHEKMHKAFKEAGAL